MKKTLSLLATLTVIGFALPNTASADHGRRIVSHLPCGRPVFSNYHIVGRDHCGRLVGRWVTESLRCSCSVCLPRPVFTPRVVIPHHHAHCAPAPRRGVGIVLSFR